MPLDEKKKDENKFGKLIAERMKTELRKKEIAGGRER
jgi:hypothetical protein